MSTRERTASGITIGAMTVLTTFDALSGFVGGAWLLLKGEWRLVVGGLIVMFLMPKAYVCVSLSQMGLAFLGLAAIDRHLKMIGTPLLLLASIYGNCVIAGWVFLVFTFFARVGSFPVFLWSYTVATSPFGFMASKEIAQSRR